MFSIWNPSLPESIDGKPLAQNVSDLFFTFPYHRLPENSFVATMMKPETVLGLIAFYIFSKPALAAWVKRSGFDSTKSPVFRTAVGLHNLFLAVYSAMSTVYSWPIVLSHLSKYGAFETYCDPHKTLWNSGFGTWATIFYISKYYEFVDTWVLVLKVRD